MAQELDLQSLDFAGIVRPGDTVMWGQATAEPVPLTRALMAQRRAIGRFNVFLGMTHSDTPRPEHTDLVAFSSYCGTGGNRPLVKAGKLDILPCHYSQLPVLIQSGKLKIDVLMLQLAPADHEGHYSFGIAHEFLIAAMDAARVVVAEVNEQAPWTYGERPVRESDLDFIVRTSRPPLEIMQPTPGDTERAIARHAAGLIEDGATLQFGLGAMPEAILGALADRRDLGIHSGTIGDTVAELTRSGAITNARKSIDPGVTVTGMMMGSKRLHDFTHRNPGVQFRATTYVHNADVLSRIDRFVVLNTAIEVDLTGQINAEVADGRYIGTIGGALDFLRAAHRSRGGLPIVALPSTAGRDAKRSSRIVARLNGPVSTPRSDAGIIITEHGIADLRGITLSERRRRMIAIAHPDFREHLERESTSPGVPGIGS